MANKQNRQVKERKDYKDRPNNRNGRRGSKPPMPKSEASQPKNGELCSQNLPSNMPTRANNPEWYNNDGLLDLAGKLSFANAVGDPFDLSTADFDYLKDMRMSGVMVLDLYSAIGYSEDNTSAINIAAQEMYTKVRSVQSSAAKYGKQDLMMYYVMVQQARNLYWNGVRALGLANLVNRMNRYIPWFLSGALGINVQDISRQANRFANILNTYAKQIAAYAIPDGMDFAKRQEYNFSNIFVDDTLPKAKLYMMRPAGYFTFELDSKQAGKLKWNNINYTKPMSVDEYAAILDKVVNSFVGDEDFGTMSGDVMKTFTSLVGWEPINADIIVAPHYDYDTLLTIHNATIIGDVVNGDITQDPGINKDYLIAKPTFAITKTLAAGKYSPLFGKRVLDLFGGAQGTPAEVAEATRLTMIPVVQGTTANAVAAIDTSCPIDVPTAGHIYTLKSGSSGLETNDTVVYYQNEANAEKTETVASFWTDLSNDWYRMAVLSQFTAAPLSMHVLSLSTGNEINGTAVHLVNRISNYTIVDKQFLGDLNRVCAMSLFSTKSLQTK